MPRVKLVYHLTEEHFDDFVNWNENVFVGFTSLQQQGLHAIVQAELELVASKLVEEKKDIQVCLLDIDSSPMIEGRYSRLRPPSFKLFQNAVPLDYTNKYNHVDIL